MTRWHILRTTTLRETTVAGDLGKAGLDLCAYVPIEIIRMPKRGVVFERRRPLMPSYVFVSGSKGVPWREIAATRHVLGWLEIDGTPASISDAEVAMIRLMEREHNEQISDGRTLRAGDRVRPTSGPFASVEVLLRAVRGSDAIIEVHMLGSPRDAKVRLDHLEKVA